MQRLAMGMRLPMYGSQLGWKGGDACTQPRGMSWWTEGSGTLCVLMGVIRCVDNWQTQERRNLATTLLAQIREQASLVSTVSLECGFGSDLKTDKKKLRPACPKFPGQALTAGK